MAQNDDGLDGFVNAQAEEAPADKPKRKGKAKPTPQEPVPQEPVDDAPTAPAAPAEESLEDRLYAVLRQRNIRNNTPTEVCFRMKDSPRRRYAIVEIDKDTIEAAWQVWKEAKGSNDQEAFMITMHGIIDAKLPRVYRQVDPLVLDD